MRTLRAPAILLVCACAVGAHPRAPAASESATPSFNLFSVEQDIEIGRKSAVEAEKQLTLLNAPSVDAYLNRIVGAVAAQAPGARYPYHATAVNDPAVNAFALPGGPLYVNRGLLLAARSEAELVGVMAHEVAHIALRHGTHQASTAYLAQAGLGILGGLFGKNSGNTAQMVSLIGGLGLNAAFLKFSRDAESEADGTGAEIMARAGYDPVAMADFFALLREEGARDPSALQAFFSDHPPAAEREARIRELARTLKRSPARSVGGFESMRTAVRRLPAANAKNLARAEPRPRDGGQSRGQPVAVRVGRPSTNFATFTHPDGLFSIGYPDNWKTHASRSGYAASFFPDGGVVDTGDGQETLLCGVIVNHYAAFDALRTGPVGLEDATDDLVKQILRSNPYLSEVSGSKRRESIDGAPELSLVLSGRSPVSGGGERVSVLTRALPDGHVIYSLLIAPEGDYDALSATFTRMLRTLEVHEDATHP